MVGQAVVGGGRREGWASAPQAATVDEIIGEFLIESYEGLDRLDQNLVILEETPDDETIVTEVFRILHTIKGTCGFLAFSKLERVAHRGESLLSLLRDQVIELDSEIADALLATVDAIRDILATIESTGEEGDADNSTLIAELERLTARADLPTGADLVADVATNEPPTDVATNEPPTDVATRDADVGADGPGEMVGVHDAVEPPNRIGDLLVDDGAANRTDVEIAAAEQGMGDDRQIGKILVDQGKAAPGAIEGAAAKQRGASDSTIRVDVAVLDNLMNLVGELVLARNQIGQLASGRETQEFVAPAQRLNLITSELQESVMQTRMQPIGSVWNKLPRVVRDLSHQFGKDVNLTMSGKSTELDRTIIEAIKDPLTHMVRNTIDHGIESAEKRLAAGKPAQGTLSLRAYHEGGQVNIEIGDDGAGIDADAIAAKAIEKRVITAEQAARLSDTDAIQLIFAPGFSTAEKVSNVSGRGVGMDVVRTNVERIGGSVEVSTTKGVGSIFKIKIPLTLAIVPAITVICDGSRYAIPQLSLQGLVRLDGNDSANRLEDVHGAPVYRLRGRLLPIVNLRKQLRVPEAQDQTTDTNIVVLSADGRQFGLVVDEIEDTAEIVVKPLGRGVNGIDVFSGATVMGDGTVALILDVLGLATAANLAGSDVHTAEQQPEPEPERLIADEASTFLVIDLGAEERSAIALADVDRLEEFALERIERSEHRPVVQYHGGIMPLVDLGQLLGRQSSIDAKATVSVVVCDLGGVVVGLAVHGILDIADNPTVHRGATGRPETVIIDGHVTDVVNTHRAISSQIDLTNIPQEAGISA